MSNCLLTSAAESEPEQSELTFSVQSEQEQKPELVKKQSAPAPKLKYKFLQN